MKKYLFFLLCFVSHFTIHAADNDAAAVINQAHATRQNMLYKITQPIVRILTRVMNSSTSTTDEVQIAQTLLSIAKATEEELLNTSSEMIGAVINLDNYCTIWLEYCDNCQLLDASNGVIVKRIFGLLPKEHRIITLSILTDIDELKQGETSDLDSEQSQNEPLERCKRSRDSQFDLTSIEDEACFVQTTCLSPTRQNALFGESRQSYSTRLSEKCQQLKAQIAVLRDYLPRDYYITIEWLNETETSGQNTSETQLYFKMIEGELKQTQKNVIELISYVPSVSLLLQQTSENLQQTSNETKAMLDTLHARGAISLEDYNTHVALLKNPQPPVLLAGDSDTDFHQKNPIHREQICKNIHQTLRYIKVCKKALLDIDLS